MSRPSRANAALSPGMRGACLVLAAVLIVGVVAVLAVALHGVGRIVSDLRKPWTAVAVDAAIGREGDGIRLSATVSQQVRGLPEFAVLDGLSTQLRDAVVEVLVDGVKVEPGAEVSPQGGSVIVSVFFRAAPGSAPLTVPLDGLGERLRPEKITVRLIDPPAACDVPLGRAPSGSTRGGRGRVGDMAMQSCPGGPTFTVVSDTGMFADTPGALRVPEARVVLTY